MDHKTYYHFFADGNNSRNFIMSENDFIFQFNLFGICSHISGATVLSFSLEDTHPHALIFGSDGECLNFTKNYEIRTLRHISGTRSHDETARIDCRIIKIEGENYLRTVAAYTVIQPTKDGKGIMFYDYKWGTGSMYFRPINHNSIWASNPHTIRQFHELTAREQRNIGARTGLPGHWMIAGKLIMPENYIDVKMYEGIFRTHNCFRAYTGAGKNQYMEIQKRMAGHIGITMNDNEARECCRVTVNNLFGNEDIRELSMKQRIELAMELKKRFTLSTRQISSLAHIPELEVRKYVL
ncbi:MAG: hypothetical protein ACI3ZC_01340 [Candidatus Cryptobacteroides sp.]